MATAKYTPQQLPLAIEDATIEITLTKGYVAIIDAIDADLMHLKWFADVKADGGIYARASKTKVYLHRAILSRVLGRELAVGEKVDHIKGNTLDNRRANLRLANNEENARSVKTHVDNISGFKGVSRNHNRFKASIWVGNKQKYLGTRATPEEAHELYKEAAAKYYGEFARFK